MPPKTRFRDPDDLIRRYEAGTSLNQLSKETGHSRPAILRLLTDRGIPTRGRSEAESLKWSRLKRDRSAVERQLSAAWEASRGRVDSEASKAKRATGFFRNRSRGSGRYELRLWGILEISSNSPVQWQYPVGPYNIDLAICETRVAVEFQRDKHRAPTSSIRADRLEYLMDRGWALLAVYVPQHTEPGLLALAKQIHAFSELVGSDPSLVGQYGMIGRNGEPVTPERFDFPDRPRIPGF